MKWLWKLFKFGLTLGLLGGIAAAIAVGAAYYYLEPDLPEIDNLREVRLQVPLKVYSRDGKLIAEFGEKRRNPLNHDQIPPRMVEAFLSAEDSNFFDHPGVDYRGLRGEPSARAPGNRGATGETVIAGFAQKERRRA